MAMPGLRAGDLSIAINGERPFILFPRCTHSGFSQRCFS